MAAFLCKGQPPDEAVKDIEMGQEQSFSGRFVFLVRDSFFSGNFCPRVWGGLGMIRSGDRVLCKNIPSNFCWFSGVF